MLSTTTKFTGPTEQGTRFHYDPANDPEDAGMTFSCLLTALRGDGVIGEHDTARDAWGDVIVGMVRRGDIAVTVWGVTADPLTVW